MTQTKSFHLQDQSELEKVVEFIHPFLKAKTVLLLQGAVGAGKTEFVKSLATKLNLTNVASPSFALHLSYVSEKFNVEHVDLYRLKSEEDLESTGFWDLFSQGSSLIIIEWAELINPEFLPLDWDQIKINFSKIENFPNQRNILIEF